MANLNPNIGPERVQVFDVPIGTVQLPGVATSITAFLLYTSKAGAPVNVPTPVTDFTTFVNTFGDADDVALDGYYAVQGFFDNAGTGNTAIIVNVASTAAASFIGSSSAGTGLRALDNQDVLGLVCIPGLPLSEAWQVYPALIDYTKTVRAEFGSTLSTSFSLLSTPKEITTSSSDVTLVTATVSTVTAPNVVFSGTPDLTNITAGMIVTKAGVYVSVITSVAAGIYTISLESVGSLATSDVVTLCRPSAVTFKDEVVNDVSRVSAWYYNPVVVTSASATPPPSGVVDVDPVGHIAGIMARIDANFSIGGVSHAPAGIRYAGIAGILGLSLSISERLDAAPLRLAFINRLTSFAGSGNVVFGGYTNGGSSVTPDEQLVQVMRSLQFIKGSLERGLRGYLWENFSPDTQAQIARSIESFMRNNVYLFPAGLPESSQFRVISIAPTQDELDQGLLKVRVQVKPNTAVRFIEIDLEFPIPTA